MKKRNKLIAIIIFLSIIILAPLITILRSHDEYLYYENRNINNFPKYDIEELLDGNYFIDIEKYFSDIFVGRNIALKINTIYEHLFLDKDKVNDVVYNDDLLLQYNSYTSFYDDAIYKYAKIMKENVVTLNDELKKRNISFYYFGVPEQMSYYSDKYPNYYKDGYNHFNTINESVKEIFKDTDVNFISIKDYLNDYKKDDSIPFDLYYKTDHHCNAYGGFVIYKKIIDEINKKGNLNLFVYDINDIEFKNYNNKFIGSRSRKVAELFIPQEDNILPIKKEVVYTRMDNGEESNHPIITYPDDYYSSISYENFMGGDFGNTIIKTNRPNLPNILIYGDSFTNVIESYLYASFNEMHSLDFRHITDYDLLDYIDNHDIDIVICVRDDTAYFNDNGNDIKLK